MVAWRCSRVWIQNPLQVPAVSWILMKSIAFACANSHYRSTIVRSIYAQRSRHLIIAVQNSHRLSYAPTPDSLIMSMEGLSPEDTTQVVMLLGRPAKARRNLIPLSQDYSITSQGKSGPGSLCLNSSVAHYTRVVDDLHDCHNLSIVVSIPASAFFYLKRQLSAIKSRGYRHQVV